MTERQLGNLGLHLPDPVFLFGGVILTRANQTNESLPPSTHTHPMTGSHIAQLILSSLPQPPKSWYDIMTGMHFHSHLKF